MYVALSLNRSRDSACSAGGGGGVGGVGGSGGGGALDVDADSRSSQRDLSGPDHYFMTRVRNQSLASNLQSRVYNFLERPTGWKCFIYHFTVYVP